MLYLQKLPCRENCISSFFARFNIGLIDHPIFFGKTEAGHDVVVFVRSQTKWQISVCIDVLLAFVSRTFFDNLDKLIPEFIG